MDGVVVLEAGMILVFPFSNSCVFPSVTLVFLLQLLVDGVLLLFVLPWR